MPTLGWEAILAAASSVFTARSRELFRAIAAGWVLCPTRRTLTGIQLCADPAQTRAHDCFAYFFRDAVWEAGKLWCTLARLVLLPPFGPPPWVLHPGSTPEHPVLQALLDDTITGKTGRQINGAGSFRDPVRSTAKHVAFTWGLNVVLLCLTVRFPRIPQPIAIPVHLCIYRKGGPTRLQLAQAMLKDLADWLPDHFAFLITADGAYASLAGSRWPRSHFCSRIRSDAAIYDLPPPRHPGQRGRPRKKGPRLPTPQAPGPGQCHHAADIADQIAHEVGAMNRHGDDDAAAGQPPVEKPVVAGKEPGSVLHANRSGRRGSDRVRRRCRAS